MASYISSFITWLTSRREGGLSSDNSPPAPQTSEHYIPAPTSQVIAIHLPDGMPQTAAPGESPSRSASPAVRAGFINSVRGMLADSATQVEKGYPPLQCKFDLVNRTRYVWLGVPFEKNYLYPFLHSSRDVYAVIHLLSSPDSLLRTKVPALPPHITSQILEEAGVFLCHSNESQQSHLGRRDADIDCLVTDPIRSPLVKPVRRIAFETISHDQGWSDMQYELKGTYTNCNSWLEVSIRRPDAEISAKPAEGESKVKEIEKRRWMITENRHATLDFTRHLIVFERGHDMLDHIRSGDQLVVHARSQYPGWSITVAGITCTVMTAA